MASLLNRAGTYYATFTDNARSPRQKRRSLKTTNRRTGERLLAKLEDAYASREWDPWVSDSSEVVHKERVAAPKRAGEDAPP